jgi:hypothetical protein
LSYNINDTLDLTGLVVTGTFSDGSTSTESISGTNISGFNSGAAVASQTLTVTVGARTTTYTISVNAVTPVVSSITISASPLTLSVGSTTQFTASTSDQFGNPINASVTWSSSDTSVGNIDASGLFTASATGTTVITGTAGSTTISATVTVTVNSTPIPAPTLSSIAITTPANKLSYNINDTLDLTGIVVTGTYSDGSTSTESISGTNISGFNSSTTTASETLTINVSGKTATYTISVSSGSIPAPTLSSIAITTPANKLSYNINDTLDLTGLVVTGTFSDGSTSTESISATNISGFNSSVANPNEVLTIDVSGKTATYTVVINGAVVPTLSSIAITTPANKLVYTVGDSLDTTGMVVTGTYSDNSTSAQAYTVTGFNSAAATSSEVLTVTVGTFTKTYTVAINAAVPAPTLSSIAITTMPKTIYTVGDSLDTTGMVVTGTFSDGSTAPQAYTVTGFDSSVVNPSEVLTVTAGTFTTTYTVAINAAAVVNPPVSSNGGGGSGAPIINGLWNGMYVVGEGATTPTPATTVVAPVAPVVTPVETAPVVTAPANTEVTSGTPDTGITIPAGVGEINNNANGNVAEVLSTTSTTSAMAKATSTSNAGLVAAVIEGFSNIPNKPMVALIVIVLIAMIGLIFFYRKNNKTPKTPNIPKAPMSGPKTPSAPTNLPTGNMSK